MVIGDIYAFYALVGDDEGVRNVAGHVGEDIIYLGFTVVIIFAESVEGAAQLTCGVNNVKTGQGGDRLNFGGVGQCVEVACQHELIRLFGKILHKLYRAEQTCGLAFVVKVRIAEYERLCRIAVLEASDGGDARTRALVKSKG